MSKRICIGKITSAHGIKGLVKILPYCEDITLLNGKLYTDEHSEETLDVTLKNPMGKYYLSEIKGINDRNAAEKLKCSLYVSRETLPELDDNDTFYVEDLIGLNALDASGKTIGTIKTVDNFGAGDLLEIHPPGGESYYVPFHDEYVTNVDLSARVVTLQNADHFKPE